MAGYRIPGPLCGDLFDVPDEGTLMRFRTPLAGSLGLGHTEHAWCLPPVGAPMSWRHAQLAAAMAGLAAGTVRPTSIPMSLSTEAIDLLKQIERLRLMPYDDQTGKDITEWVAGATVGYGHLIPQTQWTTYKGGLTEAQSEELLKQDLAPFEKAVREGLKVTVAQQQFDALTIFAFNIGASGFKNSSVLTMVNDASAKTAYATLEDAWMAWSKSQGKVMKGLLNRRQSEWNIYSMGVYKGW